LLYRHPGGQARGDDAGIHKHHREPAARDEFADIKIGIKVGISFKMSDLAIRAEIISITRRMPGCMRLTGTARIMLIDDHLKKVLAPFPRAQAVPLGHPPQQFPFHLIDLWYNWSTHSETVRWSVPSIKSHAIVPGSGCIMHIFRSSATAMSISIHVSLAV